MKASSFVVLVLAASARISRARWHLSGRSRCRRRDLISSLPSLLLPAPPGRHTIGPEPIEQFDDLRSGTDRAFGDIGQLDIELFQPVLDDTMRYARKIYVDRHPSLIDALIEEPDLPLEGRQRL